MLRRPAAAATLAALLLVQCAHRGAPPGGPEDKTPPRVVAVTPAPDSLQVPRDVTARFVFSEWINTQGIEKNIFISPTVPAMKIKASGRTVKVVPREDLLDSTTYCITIGTAVKDLRGNGLPSAFTLSFSTGDFLDSGSVQGLLLGENGVRVTQGFSIGAYLVSDTAEPDPVALRPAYMTQVGSDGMFRLIGLKFGAYRLFAISDANMNKRFDPGREKIALTSRDVLLDAATPACSGLVFVPMELDTNPLFIRNASSKPGGKLFVSFNKPVIGNPLVDPVNYRIVSADSSEKRDTLGIRAIHPVPGDSLSILILVSTPKHGRKYEVRAGDLTAWDNAVLDTARNTYRFLGNGSADSIAPEIVRHTPAANAMNVPAGDTLRFRLSEPVKPDAFTNGFGLSRLTFRSDTLDSTVRTDTLRTGVPGSGTFDSPMEFRFVPDSLAFEAEYEWKLDPKKFIDASGCFSPDSALGGRFRTVRAGVFGAVSGRVSGPDSAACRIRVFSFSGEKIVELKTDPNGRYAIKSLPEAAYRVYAYGDRNNNGAFDKGALKPFLFSERVRVISDSLFIRQKWEILDLNFSLEGGTGHVPREQE
jgi:hypothetical protein